MKWARNSLTGSPAVLKTDHDEVVGVKLKTGITTKTVFHILEFYFILNLGFKNIQ